MNVKNKFKVEKIGDEVVVTQFIIKTMSEKESLSEFSNLGVEVTTLKKSRDDLSDAIVSKKLESDLDDIGEQLVEVESLQNVWEGLNKPFEDNLEKEVRVFVKKAKADNRYKSADSKSKFQIGSKVMAGVAEKFELDVGCPMMRKVRMEFDSI